MPSSLDLPQVTLLLSGWQKKDSNQCLLNSKHNAEQCTLGRIDDNVPKRERESNFKNYFSHQRANRSQPEATKEQYEVNQLSTSQ